MDKEFDTKMCIRDSSSTMCTGNLKSGTELLCSAEHKGNWKKRREGLHYYWIDLVFLGGAALGVLCCSLFAERAIWFCMASLLAAILFIMYHKRESDTVSYTHLLFSRRPETPPGCGKCFLKRAWSSVPARPTGRTG